MADAVDRLFAKFACWYGKHWLDMWAGIDLRLVKKEWANELAIFNGYRLKYGLDCCKRRKFPPTLPEFIEYCESTPKHLQVPDVPKLEHNEAPPLSRAEARARLAQLMAEANLRGSKLPPYIRKATEDRSAA